MARSDKTVGCFLAKRLYEPDVEYWRSSTSQEELLSKPPHEAVFIDGPEQVEAYFEQLRPVPDAYRQYLPDASRLDKLPSYGGYGLLVLPIPVVSAQEGLTEQVQAAVQAAGPVWLAGTDVPHCRTLFPAEDGYFVTVRTLPLDLEHHRRGSRWRSHSEEYVEVRYAPRSARRSLHARRHLAKRDAISVVEVCQLIDALADEARSAGQPHRFALSCVQLCGASGKIVATDGQQALIQSGYTFPWTDDLLVPASGVFGCRELSSDEPIQVGRTEDWVTFRVGPWTISLKLEKDARFPDVSRHIADPAAATSHLRIAPGDGDFLTDALPRLPCEDETNYPITVDLNGHVLIRGKAADQSRATELVLSSSRLDGDPITVSSNREYLLRAMRLGFREVHLFGREQPVQCDDGRRSFVWALLNPDSVIPSSPDLIRIASAQRPADGACGHPKAKQPRRPTVMSDPTTQTPPIGDKPAAKAKRSPASRRPSPIEQAISFRDALRAAVVQANELIRSLKQQKREARLVQTTLASLRQLQKVGT